MVARVCLGGALLLRTEGAGETGLRGLEFWAASGCVLVVIAREELELSWAGE